MSTIMAVCQIRSRNTPLVTLASETISLFLTSAPAVPVCPPAAVETSTSDAEIRSACPALHMADGGSTLSRECRPNRPEVA